MGSGRRSLRRERRLQDQNENTSHKKINKVKILIIIVLLIIVCLAIYFLLNKQETTNQSYEKIEDEIIEKIDEEEDKTIEDIISEFGGEVIEQLKNDTYYIKKDGKEYTVYLDGDIVEGRIMPWNGNSSQPAIDEAGNVNIYNAEELKWIADQVISGAKNFSGVTITLRNHIDLGARKNADGIWEGNTWSSIIGYLDEIPNSENSKTELSQEPTLLDESVEVIEENLKRFAGAFDGNGFSIRGMNINSDKNYQGLFGYSTGTIANLTIKNSYIKGNKAVGTLVGLNGGTITDCTVENVEVIANEKAGGIAGVSMTSSMIINCVVDGDNSNIYSDKYTGGVIGYVNNNTSIQRCINKANIKGKEYVGGISGIAFYGTTIEDSKNNAKAIIGNDFVGGLVGYSEAQITDSSNCELDEINGTISGSNFVGGLVGINYLMGDISNSYNAGKVMIKENNGGGIVGVNNSTISNCYNTGEIKAEESSINIGGICGQNSSESVINSSYNIGKILNTDNIGGAIASNFGNASNIYYLDTCISTQTNDSEYVKSENDMKTTIITSLGEQFVEDSQKINSGFPILIWQKTESNN